MGEVPGVRCDGPGGRDPLAPLAALPAPCLSVPKTQVRLPAAHGKCQDSKAGAPEEESGFLKCRPPEKVGGSHPKAHLHIPEQAEVSVRRERGSRTKRSVGQGLETSLPADWHSLFDKDL